MGKRKSGELVLSFFIHGRGTSLQKSPLGMFRALLNSMLLYFPQYLSQLTERFEEREKRFGSYRENRWDWAEKELQDFMTHVLIDGAQNHSVAIFVDALDECGEDIAKGLLVYFKDLIKDTKSKGSRVKICISSRHYPILGHNTIPTVSVEERNDKDIRLVIQQRLKEIEPQTEREKIEKDVLLKAHGGFQWTVLITNRVIEGNVRGIKAEKLRETLASIPENLDELYTDILSGATNVEQDQMAKLFEWILFSERPLSAQELRDALATDMDTIYTTISEIRDHSVWVKDLAQFETQVKQISRGLVEFQTRDIWEKYEPDGEDSDREAQFIHQSVVDYVSNKFLNKVNQRYDSFKSQIGAAHFQISRSCLRYLTIRELLQGCHLSRGKLSAGFPLAPYAIRFLFHHVQKVEQERIPQLDLLSLIRWESRPALSGELTRLWGILDPGSAHAPIGWPFVGATELHIIITVGLKSTLDVFLQGNDAKVNGKDINGDTPLHLAIRERHQDMALALLNWPTKQQHSHDLLNENTPGDTKCGPERIQIVDVNAKNNDEETPLNIARIEGDGEVIYSLIDAGANPTSSSEEFALIRLALCQRNEKLLLKLIENFFAIDGAVYYALDKLYNKEDEILQSLISHLIRAGGNTRKSVQFYMDSESGNGRHDPKDDEAFILAVRRDQAYLVNVLLSCGATPVFQDVYGRSPLHYAVLNGQEKIVGMLAHVAPSTIAMKDIYGATPFHSAVRNRQHQLVKLLLNTGKVDLNTKDGDGLTPLWLAAKNGDKALSTLLLNTGKVDVNAKDDYGLTPLCWAARNMDKALAKLLLDTGKVEVNAKDEYGLTPLWWAAMNKDTALYKLLLDTGKVEVNVEDEYRLTQL